MKTKLGFGQHPVRKVGLLVHHAVVLGVGIFLAAVASGLAQPTITRQPTNQSVSLGASVTFRVTATTTNPPLSFQWRLEGLDLLSKTNLSLSLTNVQLTDGRAYDIVVSDTSGSVTSQVAHLDIDPTFTKITTGPIVANWGYPGGGAWGDYNNDGLLDLLVFNGDSVNASPFAQSLYRNEGGGKFTLVTNGSPSNVPTESYSACWGDYDNDGNLDLFIATTSRSLLFNNNGDGGFTRITAGSLVTKLANSYGASWADYDNDGLLDLYVGIFDSSSASNGLLYHNNGDGTFTSVTNNAVVTDHASSLSCIWADYDDDGYPDLFVCGGTGHGPGPRKNRLYHNNGDGTFERVTTGRIGTDVGYSGGAAWGDYDNDGLMDLFVANLDIGRVGNFLYHNNGNGTFTRITNDVVATNLANAYSCAWGDYDNDGYLDLFVANVDLSRFGYPSSEVNFLYHNNGDGSFTRITTGSPANDYSDSFGCSWVDYDNDGFLDLFVSRGVARNNYLYKNNGNSNNWLAVKLVGTVSNRSAIGAKVRVNATIGGVSRWQLRQITGGSGWVGHNELRANFGLGGATNVDFVRVEWPSGIVQTMTNIAVNQLLTVMEYQNPGAVSVPQFTEVSRSPSGAVNLSVTGDTGLFYLFEVSTNLVNWNWLGVRSNATGNIQFADPAVTNFPKRFYRVSVP